MWSSPAIRPFSQENTDSLMARKGGNNETLLRKPFMDRDVNDGNSPFRAKVVKSKEQINLNTNKEAEIADSIFCDVFSYKDYKDEFEDICFMSERLTEKKVNDILYSYCNYRAETPPPETIDYFDNNSLKLDNSIPSYDDSGVFNIFEESFDDVSLPSLDFDDSSLN